MFALYQSSYDATSAALFFNDLAGKDDVLLLRAGTALAGFTTLRVFDAIWRSEPLRVVFSGDTVVERRHWGQQALSLAWVRHLGRLKRQQPDKRLVWLLLVKGHRTYRYLHVFARHFHPQEGQDDSALAGLAAHLAHQLYPQEFNPASGVVEFSPSRGQLKPALAEPRPDELGRPGVAFFMRSNPGFRAGNELVCVCDVAEHNMKPMTLRLFRQGLDDTERAA